MLDWSDQALWWVVAAPRPEVRDLGGKVKFKRCRIVYCGDRATATGMIAERYPGATRIVGRVVVTSDNDVTLSGGARCHFEAGAGSRLVAGRGANLRAGHNSRIFAGDGAVATAGNQ
jgi:hypothetical protein